MRYVAFLFLKLPSNKCPYSKMTMMSFIRINLWEIGHHRALNNPTESLQDVLELTLHCLAPKKTGDS